jgi:L-rhamnose isomerase / sugar isomerase
MTSNADETRLHAALDAFELELPSWGFSNTGTRFRVFPQAGTPRNAHEKIDDVATVHRYTGAAPRVSLHIPWDRVEDMAQLAQYAQAHGVSIGGINANTFQDEDYRLGSLGHPSNTVRRKAMEHMRACVDVMEQTSSSVLKIWLGDGTNYPGQDDFRARKRRLQDGLREVHDMLPDDATMLVEYKLYEPALYHTDIQDWGMALLFCRFAGDRARVVVDLGHHAQGVNIEQIVAVLLDEERLGAFDLNDRKYGDDDLMAGSVNPYQLFLIFHELVSAEHASNADGVARCARRVKYMVDQAHNIEAKVPAMIRTVTTLQEHWLKAQLVDREALAAAQVSGEIVAANDLLKDAYDTDVRSVISRWREARGLPSDPVRAYLASGEVEQRQRERAEGVAAGWG